MRFLVVCAFFCAMLFVGCQSPATMSHDHGGSETAHEPYELVDIPAPTVALSVAHDAVAGYNVHVTTTNFLWTPEKVNQPDEAAAGHAHLYVDDTKVARLYGPDFHLTALPMGVHTVRVELNSNTHRPFSVGGVAVAATQQVTVDHVD